MASSVDLDVAGYLRNVAGFYEHRQYSLRARTLRQWADELDPPELKCTYPGCHHIAMFRLSADETDELPGSISYRCAYEHHVISWLTMNAPHGTVKVDLI